MSKALGGIEATAVEEASFYVLYCCKRCDSQFKEKAYLLEHQKVCEKDEKKKKDHCKTESTDRQIQIKQNQQNKLQTHKKHAFCKIVNNRQKPMKQIEFEKLSQSKPGKTKKVETEAKTGKSNKNTVAHAKRSLTKQEKKPITKREIRPTVKKVETIEKASRSKRETKPTMKFKEYLIGRNNNLRTSKEDSVITHESVEISCQVQDMEDKQQTKCSKPKKVKINSPTHDDDEINVKPIANAVKSGDSHAENKLNFACKSSNIDNKEESCEKSSKRKREKIKTNAHKVSENSKKAKKCPIIPVNLEEYPDSFCTEEYLTLDPLYKGKSAREKLCERYLCKLCNAYRTVSKAQMEKHISLHVSQRLNCQYCDLVANSEHNLSTHVRKEHQKGIFYICELCGAGFSDVRRQKAHLTKVHNEAAFKCEKCGHAFFSNQAYKEHILNEHKDGAFKCEKCAGIFLQKKLLEKHVNNNICEAKSLNCPHCGLEKKSKQVLNEHIKRVHSKEHQFKCNLCSFSTGLNYMLKQHMRAHLRIHPHKCDQCSFSCVKKWQLVSHMRTHSGEKGYKCKMCSFAAAWNVQLKAHMKAHESDKQKVCQACNIVFKDQRCLGTHVKKVHTNPPLKTAKSRSFASSSPFKRPTMVPVEGTNLVVYTIKETGLEAEKSTSTSSYMEGNDKRISQADNDASIQKAKDLNTSQHKEENKTDGSESIGQLSETVMLNASERASSGGNRPVKSSAEINIFNNTSEAQTMLVDSSSDQEACTNLDSRMSSLKKQSVKSTQTGNESRTLLAGLLKVPLTVSTPEKINNLKDPVDSNDVSCAPSTMASNSIKIQSHCSQYGDGTNKTTLQVHDKETVTNNRSTDQMHTTSHIIAGLPTNFSNYTGLNAGKCKSIETEQNCSSNALPSSLVESSTLTSQALPKSVKSKNDVTYIRMHTDPDGTRRYEVVDPRTVSSLPILVTQQSQSGDHVTHNNASQMNKNTQDTHNYAVPVHKQKKLHDRYVASSYKQCPEAVVHVNIQNVSKESNVAISLPSNTVTLANSSDELVPEDERITDSMTYIHVVSMEEPDTVYEVVTEGEEIVEADCQEITIPV